MSDLSWSYVSIYARFYSIPFEICLLWILVLSFWTLKIIVIFYGSLIVYQYESLINVTDAGQWEMLPKGTCSVFVQPVIQAPNPSAIEVEKIEGFVLLASSMTYAYSHKDRAWIKAVSNKFRGKSIWIDLKWNWQLCLLIS